MSNELLLIISLFIYFGAFLFLFYFFGKKGLIIWNCIALIMANIEVGILVDAFGLTMTLGNVAFASSFLVTDLLCERYNKKTADRVVLVGFLVSIIFVLITQFCMLYTPSTSDKMLPHFIEVFTNSPRTILAGLIVYVFVQLLDVRLYYKWWSFTKKLDQDKRKFLWVRNNLSTVPSQFFNAILFNVIAFYGVQTNDNLIKMIVSSFIIYVVTSILDTPFLYLSRGIKPKNLLD